MLNDVAYLLRSIMTLKKLKKQYTCIDIAYNIIYNIIMEGDFHKRNVAICQKGKNLLKNREVQLIMKNIAQLKVF